MVYTALYGDKKTWIRPKYMFFEKVPDGKENPNNQKYRFCFSLLWECLYMDIDQVV